MSAEGKVFYINHIDKTTHWTRPETPLSLLPQEDQLPLEDVVDHSPEVPPEDLGKPQHSDLTEMQTDHTPFATAESAPRSSVPSPDPHDDPSAYTRPDSIGNSHADVGAGVGAYDLTKDGSVVDNANTDFTDTTLEEVADVHPRDVSLSSGGGRGGERAPSATVSAPTGTTDRALSGVGSVERWESREPVQPAQPVRGVASLRSADVLLLQTEMETVAGGREQEQGGEGEDAGDASTDAAAGPVSSIVKSGLFGSTVRATGGSVGSAGGGSRGGSANGSVTASHAADSSSAVAAATAGAGDGAAAAASRSAGVGTGPARRGGMDSEPPPLGLGDASIGLPAFVHVCPWTVVCLRFFHRMIVYATISTLLKLLELHPFFLETWN